MTSIFVNELFLNDEQSSSSSSNNNKAPKITLRDILSPSPLVTTITSATPHHQSSTNIDNHVFIKNLIICTYIADWNWFAAELSICPFITPETQIYVIINWVPETCNTEDELENQVFSEGIRQVEIFSKNEKLKRKIFVIHPALVGGLMHVKLNLVQFSHHHQGEEKFDTRVVIGSANLTADDWYNLRQAFFVAEGKTLSSSSSPSSSKFTKQLEFVLAWLSLPRKILDSLSLDKISWNGLPENTTLIFSVPSSLQKAINDQKQLVAKKKQREEARKNGAIDGEKKVEEEQDNGDDDDEIEFGILPLEPPSIGGTSMVRRKFLKTSLNPHAGREAFYSEFLPVSFELNSKYVPPLQMLRNCVEIHHHLQNNNNNNNNNRKTLVYQASGVGGITDTLYDHFIAATDASFPYPPLSTSSSSGNKNEDAADENHHNVIVTPFPSATSVVRNASEGGWSGAITLRYFQLSNTKLFATGWRRSKNVDGPTCHTKLLYFHQDPSSWLVLGSHNFTSDCWAFAKQMLPRNFELSVFVPSSYFTSTVKTSIAELFPVQTSFESEEEMEMANRNRDRGEEMVERGFSHNFSHHHHHHFHHHHHHRFGPSMGSSSPMNGRFVFLYHKRDFFAALQASEAALYSRCNDVAEKMSKETSPELKQIFQNSLSYHYSKFKNEVHDDFGRH